MSRYTGPKARVSRRLGTNIWGTKGETIALDKRPYPPGDHGRTRRRGRRGRSQRSPRCSIAQRPITTAGSRGQSTR